MTSAVAACRQVTDDSVWAGPIESVTGGGELNGVSVETPAEERA
ncbi:hypothetical protein [Mycobacterium sp. Aquia_213]|nr:hypothetical protein [Mycobacterium sp. Aquia_213]WAC94599.1 hypothetical protein LMQ14_24010 [Mycobacterium sp. Aquia_213]